MPSSVTFAADETSKQFVFAATDDSVDDDGESVRLSFGVLPAGVTAVSPVSATVAIVDDDDRQRRGPGDGGGILVTITQVEDGATFIEGTWARYRLQFAAVGGGALEGDGVDVELSFFWHNESPVVSPHGQATKAVLSLWRVDSWDSRVKILDNDVGNPDGTVTIRITGCERNGCIIGTPSEITLAIVDDDGGPEAAIPGPSHLPRLVCASSGDGYDDTGIAVSWKAPEFVGGAPVEFYELRYRQSARFVQNRLVLDEWEYWPDRGRRHLHNPHGAHGRH